MQFDIHTYMYTPTSNLDILAREARLQHHAFMTVCRSVKAEHSVWQECQWGSVDCQVVEEATTRQINMIEGFPNFTHSWDIHQHLLSYLHAMQVRPQLHVGSCMNSKREM